MFLTCPYHRNQVRPGKALVILGQKRFLLNRSRIVAQPMKFL